MSQHHMSNFYGNAMRVVEMTRAGLSVEEQSVVFQSNGISVSPGVIEAISGSGSALMNKALPRAAVAVAIKNHDQISNEGSFDDEREEDNCWTEYIDGRYYSVEDGVYTDITDEVEG